MGYYKESQKIANERIAKKLQAHAFVELKHLECEINIEGSKNYQLAISTFQNIEKLKTPRDKLLAIVNGSKILSGLIWHSQKEMSNPTGADEFLPVLIYTVLKSCPSSPYTSINFIRDFRHYDKLKGLDEYYYTAYESAIEFIDSLESSKLRIDSEQYQSLLLLSLKRLEEESAAIKRKEVYDMDESIKQKILKIKLLEIKEKIDKMKFKLIGKDAENLAIR